MTFFFPQIKVSLFVSTADKNAELLPQSRIDDAIQQAEIALFSIGATGFSTSKVTGGWKTEDGTLIRETTHIVYSFINGINEVDLNILQTWAENTKHFNNQDSVLFTVERVLTKTVFV